MCKRVLLCGLLMAMTAHMGFPQNINAAEATGTMSAVIMDPLLIDLKEAKRFCKDEPQSVKCDILRERLKQKNENRDNNAIQAQVSYDVLSAHFE